MKKAIAFDPDFKNRGKGRRRGKVSVDTDAQNLTGSLTFYATPEVPDEGYVIISDGNTAKGIAAGSAKPVFWTATDDTVVDIVNGLPNNSDKVYTTAEALDYLRDNDYFVLTSNADEIVTDELVLELDASKRSSFIDNEPLTNVARVDTWSSTWNNSGTATWNSNDTTVPRLFPDITVQSMRKDTNGNSHLGVGNVTSQIAEGVECTFSLFVYIPSSNSAGMSGAAPYMRPFPANYNATYLKYNGSTSWGSWPRDRWIRIEGTATPAANGNGGTTSAYISSYLNTAGDKIYYTAPQFELGSKATAFVSGSRAQNTTWHDLSGNDNNATLYNAPLFVTNSFDFNGTDEYAQVSSVTTDLVSSDFTLSALIKGGTQDHKSILSFNTSGGSNRQLWMVRNAGMGVYDSGNWYIGSIDVDNDKWHYVVATYDYSTRNLKTYTDGVNDLNTTTGNTINVQASDTANIGMEYDGGTATDFFNGKISKIKVYNKVLSQDEVSQNYYGGPIVTDGLVFAIDAGNLVSYENSSTTTYSMTGSNSGTLTNGTGYSSNNGGSFVFDGTNDYTAFTISPSISLRCLETWFYNENAIPGNDTTIGGPTTYQTVFRFNEDYPMGVNLGAWTSGMTNEAIHIWSTGASPYKATNTREAVLSGWHHLIFNWNGSYYDIYVDGVQQDVYAHAGGHATLIELDHLTIGSSISPNYSFNGKIPITRIYNQSLTDSEIGQNFEAQRARFGL